MHKAHVASQHDDVIWNNVGRNWQNQKIKLPRTCNSLSFVIRRQYRCCFMWCCGPTTHILTSEECHLEGIKFFSRLAAVSPWPSTTHFTPSGQIILYLELTVFVKHIVYLGLFGLTESVSSLIFELSLLLQSYYWHFLSNLWIIKNLANHT